jgi:signal transduction histidine kinase
LSAPDHERKYTVFTRADDGLDRVRLLNLFAYLLGGFATFFALYGFVFGRGAASTPLAVAAVLAFATPALLRRTGRYDHASIGLLISFFVAIFLSHALGGSGAYRQTPWGTVLPVVAWALAGRRTAWWTALAVGLAYAGFLVSDLSGWVAWPHPELGSSDLLLYGLSTASVVFAVLILFDAVFEADRKARLALVEARDQARAAEAEKAKLVAYISHELRTPIAGIIGASELLAMGDRDARASEEVVGILIQASQQLLRTTDELIEVHREKERSGAAVAPVPFRVEPLLAGVVALCRPLALQQGIEITLRAEGGDDLVIGYPQRVRQILHNLLINALRHSGARSVRVVLSRSGYRGDEVLLTCSVIDDGCGIAEGEAMFDAYERLGAESKGTGLGLSVAKELAESMGASLAHGTPTGGGARFDLHFSVSRAPAGRSDDP